jgi:hypothetical protein
MTRALSRAIAALLLVLCADPVLAQVRPGDGALAGRAPRRQFVTLTIDGMNTLPLHFEEQPLEQLVGQELSPVHDGSTDYRTIDGLTTVDVLRFRRRNRGVGIMIYPLGAGNGTSLAIRGSIEELPVIEFVASGPSGAEYYQLTDGRATDVGAGLIVNDRSAGWGLGSHAFVVAGVGRLSGERGDGRRIFAEGGGGISSGPFGMQLALKFARNTLEDPRAHSFFTVPITLRGTLSF